MTTWFYPGQEDYITKLNELGTIAELTTGANGWTPVFAAVQDGNRVVLKLTDWVGGSVNKPAINQYLTNSGLTSDIALATDIRGAQGLQGEAGTDGLDGEQGPAGPANTLTIGTVVSSATPTATITGTSPNQVLNLELPKGDKGDTGDKGDKGDTGDTGPANTLTIGTVTSGGVADATITGTSPNQVLNLVLPKGDTGLNGTDGLAATITIGTVTTGAPGSSASVVNSGTSNEAVLDFTIPRGEDGSGAGNVLGPAASVDNEVALFDGVTGKAIKGGGVLNTGAYAEQDRWKLQAFNVMAITTNFPPSWALGSYYPYSEVVVSNGHTAIRGFNGDVYTMTDGVWVLTGPFDVNTNGSRIAFAQTGESGPFLWTRVGGVTVRTNMLQGSSNIRYSEGTIGVDFVNYTVRQKLTEIGRLINLTTTDKASIVAAINELVSSKANVSALGTAAALNVPATGDASTSQVVKGDDTRLSDSRPPTGTAGGVLSGSYPNPGFAVDMATQAELDAVSDVANAKLSDAPSDGKTYGRKDGTWSEVVSGGGSGYATGDVVVTARTLSAPDYVLPNAVYLQSSYAALFAEIGIIGDWKSSNSKLANPAALPTGTGLGCSWDSSGTYLAVAHATSPFITVYERSGSTLTKLANPAVLPTGNGLGCSWDSSGTYLAVGHDTSPFISVYERSGSTLTKLANPAVLPASSGVSCSWDSSGTYLAVAHATSPFITVYERSGSTLTKLANPAVLPASSGRSCSWDSSGTYLAVAHVTSPFITVYERSGSTLTKLANPAALPPANGFSCSWDSSGTYLAVGHDTSPFISVYERSGLTLTKLANPAVLPGNVCRSCSWDSSGTYLVVTYNVTPFITVYERSGLTLTKLADPAVLPTGTGRGCAWGANGGYLAVAQETSPYITAYSALPYDPSSQFMTPKVYPAQLLPMKTYIKA